jgi:preprotein translocase subunit YajC
VKVEILFVYVVIVVGVFYLFAVRPQRRRRQAQRELLSTIEKGDEIVTNDGMCGTVRQVRDNFVVLEIAERKQVRFLKASVSAVVAKGRPAKGGQPAKGRPAKR